MSITVALYIVKGVEATLKIFAMTLLFSIPFGFLFAIGKIAGGKIIRFLLECYTWLIRGTPLMLQIIFIYYGLPLMFHFTFDDRIYAAFIAFSVNYAAYFTEIFRAGILSVDKGQFEAAKALGMTYPQTMLRIVIPQAVKRSLPPMGNEFITLVKDTALVIVIAIPDVMRNTKEVVSRDVSFEAFFVAAAIYLALTYVIVMGFKIAEKKLDYYD